MQRFYVDAHLHLQESCFAGLAAELADRAESAGVGWLFCNAVTEADWDALVRMAHAHHCVVPFFGIHPWYCAEADRGWQARLADRLVTLAELTVGIGETGLDKVKPVDFDLQRQCFKAHLELAADLDLPVSIHCVKAWGPLLETLAAFGAGRTLPRMLIHSFNGSVEIMKRLVGYGCFISYSCAIANAGNHSLRNTVKQTPISAMMLETDSPFQKSAGLDEASYLTAGHNEPSAVAALYRYAAGLLDLDINEFSSLLWNNAAIFTNQTADR